MVLAGLGGALMLLDSRAAGFGAFGWVGLALLIAALGLGAATVQQFLFTLCGAAALSAAAVPVMLLRLPHSAAMAKIQLDERLETGTGRAARTLPEPGARGRACGDLKPRGPVEIAGERYEARAERFLEKGAAVRVVQRRAKRSSSSARRRSDGGGAVRRQRTASPPFGSPRALRGKFGGQHCRPVTVML